MNADSEVQLRPAQPTNEDGLAAARFIDMASEGGIRMAIGKRYEEVIVRAFCEPDHDLSYQRAVFAESGGKVLGMMIAYGAASHEASSLEPLLLAPGNRLRRKLGLSMLRFIFGRMAGHKHDDHYLAFLAVDPEARGLGVGSRLFARAEEIGREHGASRFVLDVSAKNDGARRLYERLGMRFVSRWPDSKILPAFVERMAKML